jgi:hypothetical protein
MWSIVMLQPETADAANNSDGRTIVQARSLPDTMVSIRRMSS